MTCKCGKQMVQMESDDTLHYCRECERIYDDEYDCWDDDE